MCPEPGYPAIIHQEVPNELLGLFVQAIRDVDGVNLLGSGPTTAGSDNCLVSIEAASTKALIELGVAFAQCRLTGAWSLEAHQEVIRVIPFRLPS